MSGPWEKYQGAPAAAPVAPVAGPWDRYAAPAAAVSDLDPTAGMSTVDRLLAATGSGLASTGRAIGLGSVLENFGMPGTKEEADRLDAPLDATTAGKVGKFIGKAAPLALAPAAGSLALAAGAGAGLSALTTEGGIVDRAAAAAGGAAGGAAGKVLGDAVGAGAKAVASRFAARAAAKKAANAGKDAALVAARGEGFVVTPSQADAGSLVSRGLEALGGKIKTQQAASVANQSVTNNLARRALGLARDTPIDTATLQQLRKQAGTAYDALKNTGTVQADQVYHKALDGIVAKYHGASAQFPGLAKPQVQQLVDTLRQPLFKADAAVDAIRVLRGNADDAFRAGDAALGKASREAAEAMEAQLERHLVNTAQPASVLSEFRDARKLIAKTYTVEKSLNAATGDVSAQKLAGQLAKGKPLSGELKSAAQFGQAFPKAAQSGVDVPPWSVLDIAAGGVGGMHNPGIAALFAARPVARSVVLNPTVQRLMVNPNREASVLSRVPAATLDNLPAKKLWKALGIEAGAELASDR